MTLFVFGSFLGTTTMLGLTVMSGVEMEFFFFLDRELVPLIADDDDDDDTEVEEEAEEEGG